MNCCSTRRWRVYSPLGYRPTVERLEARQLLTSDLTFADPLLFDVDENPEFILVADLNGDEHADLISATTARQCLRAARSRKRHVPTSGDLPHGHRAGECCGSRLQQR